MRHLHVCWNCQLSLRLRSRLHILRDVRRGITVSATCRQQVTIRPRDSGNVTFNRIKNRNAPSQSDGYPSANASAGVHSEERGRYSGKRLQPEDVLRDLARPSDITGRRPNGVSAPSNAGAGNSPNLSEAMRGEVSRFLSSRTRKANMVDSLSLLETMSASPEAELLSRYPGFVSAFNELVLKRCQQLFRILSPNAEPVLTPSQLLALSARFGMRANQVRWSKMLGQLCRRLLRLYSKGGQNSTFTLRELVTLWHLALYCRLQGRASDPVPNLTIINWSFLPPTGVLADRIKIRQPNYTIPDLAHAIQYILPVSLDSNSVADELERWDPESIALVTLHFMRASPPEPDFAPLINLLNTLLLETTVSPAPMALSRLYRGSSKAEIRAGCEAVAKSFGLSLEGPTVVEGAELSSAKTPLARRRKVRTKAVVQFAYESTTADGFAVSESDRVEILEPDNGDGWVKVKVSPKESENADIAALEGWMPASYLRTEEDQQHENTQELPSTSGMESELQSTEEVPNASAGQNFPDTTAVVDSLSGSGIRNAPQSPDDALQQFIAVRTARLRQAVQKQNIRLAEQVKTDIYRHSSDPAKPPLPDSLFNTLLLSFLTLHDASSAVEIWKFLTDTLKRSPTVTTFTAMMRGAQEMHDTNIMERFWSRMRDSKIQPDAQAWTTRIYGLIRGGKVREGLEAWRQMCIEWFDAARARSASSTVTRRVGQHDKGLTHQEMESLASRFPGDVDGVPRPNQVLMNAVISALSSKSDQDIPQVLAWGRVFGLEPDRVTYNRLLNVSMRHGSTEEAVKILQRMQESGVGTDSSTWIILLTNFFVSGTLNGLTHAEQKDRVLTFIKALDAMAAPFSDNVSATALNAKGYTLAIDRLLKNYGNSDAANAVVAYMLSRGLQLDVQIYTTLMQFYFRRDPPDLEAVAALWRQIQSSDNGHGVGLNSIFYDIMIEGYAQNHPIIGIQPLIQFLNQAAIEKRRPSWRTLRMAAQALAERCEWARLVAMVDETRRWLRNGSDGEIMVGNRRALQRDFWQYIIELGLLKDEGIQTPEHIMRGPTGETPLLRRLRAN